MDYERSHDINPGDGSCVNQDGCCSIRAAIEEANANPGDITDITFSVAGQITIFEGSLPDINVIVTIDASSVWGGTGGKPGIELNGNNGDFSGLTLKGGTSWVCGLYIHNFKQNAIRIESDSNVI